MLNLRRILTIVRKELLVLLDNKVSRMMLIVPPLMQIVIFAWAATMEVRNVEVAVLNHDAGHGTLFLLITHFGFGVPLVGSLVLIYTAMLVFSLAAGGIGLMVSSLSSTQQQAFLGAFTVGVPCILISGAVTPIANMPAFLRHASQLNPLRHFIVITQGVFLKDITMASAVVSGLKITAIAAVAVTVAVWMFKRKA